MYSGAYEPISKTGYGVCECHIFFFFCITVHLKFVLSGLVSEHEVYLY